MQVPLTLLFHKCQQKTPAGQTFYGTISLHIYGGRQFFLNRDMKKEKSSDHFPQGTGCMSWFLRMSAGTKLKCAFNISSVIRKKKIYWKSQNFAFFMGYTYTQGMYAILTKNSPSKSGELREHGNFQAMQRLKITMCILINLANYKRNN